jgi:hypothetical protein
MRSEEERGGETREREIFTIRIPSPIGEHQNIWADDFPLIVTWNIFGPECSRINLSDQFVEGFPRSRQEAEPERARGRSEGGRGRPGRGQRVARGEARGRPEGGQRGGQREARGRPEGE